MRTQICDSKITKVVIFLKLLTRDSAKVQSLLESGFRAVTPDAIRRWVTDKVELLPRELQELYFENRWVAPFTKQFLLRNRWLLEYYLGKPQNLLEELVKANSRNADALRDENVRKYVISQIESTYSFILRFIMEG